MKHRVGRVQRAVWRPLVAAGGRPVPTSAMLEWCYPRGPKVCGSDRALGALPGALRCEPIAIGAAEERRPGA
jgi:hypothetical protein